MDSAFWNVLTRRLGDIALLNGLTLPQRANRPEILLSLPEGSAPQQLPMPSTIVNGALVRVWSGPSRGARGQVVHLFAHERVIGSGQWEPCAQLRLSDGSTLTAPLQLLDVIG